MIKQQLAAVVAKAAKALYGVKVEPEITYTEPQFGDFATNVAFGLAKRLKKSPADIAKKLAAAIKDPDIKSAQAAGAGFINITMAESFWIDQLGTVDSKFVLNDSGKNKKVQVEFISANPTGPLTLGNGRGGFNGDVVANVLSANGYAVSREYYINDAGNQIASLVNSVMIAAGKAKGAPPYQGAYIKELATQFKSKLDEPVSEVGPLIIDFLLEHEIKPAIKQMGINFDVWLSEHKELHQTGKVVKILELLKSKGLTEERDGATWLKEGSTEERERVLIKSDGTYSYLLVDIAYHWNKLVERKLDKVINLWGADHAGQVPSLQAALKLLGLEGRLEILLFQLVRLIKDGKEYKVSKRAGTYVTIGELLLEVPADVARFFFLMRSRDTHMDFDLDLAKEQSQKNPYYYVMYAYVRAQSILKKAKANKLMSAKVMSQLDERDAQLARHMLQLPELVSELGQSYEVHKLTFYGIELARLFHDWYEQEPIINLPKARAGAKLYLLDKFVLVMQAYFSLLGIKPHSKM